MSETTEQAKLPEKLWKMVVKSRKLSKNHKTSLKNCYSICPFAPRKYFSSTRRFAPRFLKNVGNLRHWDTI